MKQKGDQRCDWAKKLPVHEFEADDDWITCICGRHLFSQCHGGAVPD